MFIRLFFVVAFFSLQSCSNTLIGEKLENSFDTTQYSEILGQTKNEPEKLNEIKKIKSKVKEDKKENETDFNNIKESSISKKNRLSQKSTKPKKKTVFNPQPYRIILRLLGANPSAPAETVTNALRNAGVQFEVEKIERFDKENLSKDTFLKR